MLALAIVQPVVSELDVAARLGLALLLGGVVGVERELSHQPAGLRTHIAVALGAALFGIVSVHGFDGYVQARADSNYQVDVTRVASQVVVAIGFLGGGTILKHGAGVRGLTTAASLWVTCAIGLAAGVGSFVAASMTAVAVLLSLVLLRKPRDILRERARERATAVVTLRRGANPAVTIRALLDVEGVAVNGVTVTQNGEGSRVEAEIVGERGVDLSVALASLVTTQDVVDVDVAG